MYPEASRTHHTTRATILPVRTSPRTRVHASALPLLGTMIVTLAVAIIVIVLAAAHVTIIPDVATLM